MFGLTVGKVYKVISDSIAEQHGMIRIIDESLANPEAKMATSIPPVTLNRFFRLKTPVGVRSRSIWMNTSKACSMPRLLHLIDRSHR